MNVHAYIASLYRINCFSLLSAKWTMNIFPFEYSNETIRLYIFSMINEPALSSMMTQSSVLVRRNPFFRCLFTDSLKKKKRLLIGRRLFVVRAYSFHLLNMG